MEKFPVCWKEKPTGELTAEKEPLHTCFTVKAALPEAGLWGAWLVGEEGELRLGILEPEGGWWIIRRRFSDRMIGTLGRFLRGEIRGVYPEESSWERVLKPEALFRTPSLVEALHEEREILTKEHGSLRWIAVLYDKEKSFPMIDFFCFAELETIHGKTYLTFCFDREERVIFGKSMVHSDRPEVYAEACSLEKN